MHPKTGLPVQTAQEWADKQIFSKTDVRIQNLAKAYATRPTQAGTSTVPSLAEVQGIHQLEFWIDATANPDLEAAVNQALARLQSKYTNWTFSVKYGLNP